MVLPVHFSSDSPTTSRLALNFTIHSNIQCLPAEWLSFTTQWHIISIKWTVFCTWFPPLVCGNAMLLVGGWGGSYHHQWIKRSQLWPWSKVEVQFPVWQHNILDLKWENFRMKWFSYFRLLVQLLPFWQDNKMNNRSIQQHTNKTSVDVPIHLGRCCSESTNQYSCSSSTFGQWFGQWWLLCTLQKGEGGAFSP